MAREGSSIYIHMYLNYYVREYFTTIIWSSDRGGSIPSATVLRLRQLSLSQIIVSEKKHSTITEVVVPVYLMSMSGEAKDPMQG